MTNDKLRIKDYHIPQTKGNTPYCHLNQWIKPVKNDMKWD